MSEELDFEYTGEIKCSSCNERFWWEVATIEKVEFCPFCGKRPLEKEANMKISLKNQLLTQ